MADEPENIGEEPENIGEEPENIGDEPENIAEEPEKIGEEPEKIGGGEEPEKFGTDPEKGADQQEIIPDEAAVKGEDDTDIKQEENLTPEKVEETSEEEFKTVDVDAESVSVSLLTETPQEDDISVNAESVIEVHVESDEQKVDEEKIEEISEIIKVDEQSEILKDDGEEEQEVKDVKHEDEKAEVESLEIYPTSSIFSKRALTSICGDDSYSYNESMFTAKTSVTKQSEQTEFTKYSIVDEQLSDDSFFYHKSMELPPVNPCLKLVEVKSSNLKDERKLTPIFLDLMCRKNKDKTKHLILRGSQLINNLKRRLRDDDLTVLCDYLKQNRSVVLVDLAYNEITSEGIKTHLAPLLKNNKILKELILSNNELSVETLEYLADIAPFLYLSTIRLNGNKLGAKGGDALARLIDQSINLTHLDISETDQTVSSLACIAAILRADYIPCTVNRFPFSRRKAPIEQEIGEKKCRSRLCSPQVLSLYVKKLVAIENAKNETCLSISSSNRENLQCASIDDLRLQNEKLSISSISSHEVNCYMMRKKREREITLRNESKEKIGATSLTDLILPIKRVIVDRINFDLYEYSCCRPCYQRSEDEKIGNTTSLTDLKLPIPQDKESKDEEEKSKTVKDTTKIKPVNSSSRSLSSASQIKHGQKAWTSLINLNLALEKEDVDKNEISTAQLGTHKVGVKNNPNLYDGKDVSQSEDEESNRSSHRRKPILKILFLDRIMGHYHYQPLTYHFARILSDMIKNNNSLRELHLEKNSLTDGDVEMLCDGLKRNSVLKLLDLSANHIACQGLSYLAECLPLSGLEALILNNNDIKDYGARCLFFTLPSTKLKMLDLGFNSITDVGMMDMLYTMRKKPKIIVLFIWGNPITHISLEKIKEYLVQGWLLTDSLDIKIYEVDGVLLHGWRWSANQYKASYYTRPRPSSDPVKEPPQSIGFPLQFEYYDTVYDRLISKYIERRNSLYPPEHSGYCAT